MAANEDYQYVGNELAHFADATNWKRYYHRQISPYIKGDVLEVGAGIGSTTQVLCDGTQASWLCLEPDRRLSEALAQRLAISTLPIAPTVKTGTLADLPADQRFDTLLYIDVLEHIEDDQAELARAAKALKPGGRVIVLCPAHNFLFSPFDEHVGHFRRYNRAMFASLQVPGLGTPTIFYLDCMGMLLSLANRLLLRASLPSPSQIRFWDRRVVPVSGLIDPLIGRRLGKTVIGVWQKQV